MLNSLSLSPGCCVPMSFPRHRTPDFFVISMSRHATTPCVLLEASRDRAWDKGNETRQRRCFKILLDEIPSYSLYCSALPPWFKPAHTKRVCCLEFVCHVVYRDLPATAKFLGVVVVFPEAISAIRGCAFVYNLKLQKHWFFVPLLRLPSCLLQYSFTLPHPPPSLIPSLSHTCSVPPLSPFCCPRSIHISFLST